MKPNDLKKIYRTKNLLLILISLTIHLSVLSQTTRVLFIGNSLTFVNNLPLQFKNIAQAAGKTVYVENATMGGATLQNHLNNGATISKIQQGNWDYVVLQEQSQLPSFVGQRSTLFYPYAKSLDSIIRIYNPCGKTVFFMTFAHRNGDIGILQNGGTDTYWAMQQRIRDGYMEISDSLNAMVCPVGWAFRQSRIQYPSLELHMSDNVHPSDTGTYLAACTFYATLFQDSAVGISNFGNVGTTAAINMQQIASNIVMDSLTLWNIGQNSSYPTANFSYIDSLLTVSFTDSSINTTNVTWYFGDGDSSSQKNPIHSYNHSGSHVVTLIANNSCHSDTIKKSIILSSQSLPFCNFSYSTNLMTVSFSDSSINANTYLWYFGDGDSSTVKSPQHSYKASGSFTVLHICINSFGKDSCIKQIQIGKPPPIANFIYSFSQDSSIINFTDTSIFATNYLWDFDDGDTSHLKNPTHHFSAIKTYNVKLKVWNSWGSDSIVKSVTINTLDINQLKPFFWNIYPNPAKDFIILSQSNPLSQSYYEIMNLSGQKIQHGFITEIQTRIDLSSLSKGLYIIAIHDKIRVQRTKFIVE